VGYTCKSYEDNQVAFSFLLQESTLSGRKLAKRRVFLATPLARAKGMAKEKRTPGKPQARVRQRAKLGKREDLLQKVTIIPSSSQRSRRQIKGKCHQVIPLHGDRVSTK